MKIGILSSGGDCPGINATIRGVGKTAIMHYGMEVIGIHSGFIGLLNKDVQVFDERSLSGILNLGGTILGTSREKPFRKLLASGDSEKPEIIKKNYEELGLDCLVCIGGNGTQKTANLLSQIGLNVIGVPKTIDNDIWGTDITFGFNTAVNIATESIDRLHSTASSHKRVMTLAEVRIRANAFIIIFESPFRLACRRKQSMQLFALDMVYILPKSSDLRLSMAEKERNRLC